MSFANSFGNYSYEDAWSYDSSGEMLSATPDAQWYAGGDLQLSAQPQFNSSGQLLSFETLGAHGVTEYPEANFQNVGVYAGVFARGQYSSSDLAGSNAGNLGGNQGSGLPFGNYQIGGGSGALNTDAKDHLYPKSTLSSDGPFTYNRQLETDLALSDVGRDLNVFASSPGSLNDNSRLQGIYDNLNFFRVGNTAKNPNYGVLAETYVPGTSHNETATTFAARAPAPASGIKPANWNQDDSGNPLPWGARREADGNVYYTSGGGSNIPHGTSSISNSVNASGVREAILTPPSGGRAVDTGFIGTPQNNVSRIYSSNRVQSNYSPIYSSGGSRSPLMNYSSGTSISNTSRTYSF